mmetsp:Transcript_18852/g.45211  ORF Transcript_18852/g.45211 Transcript_18852/m.45211 type:complete len:216 (+) Transcript_18852:964-1611(+)
MEVPTDFRSPVSWLLSSCIPLPAGCIPSARSRPMFFSEYGAYAASTSLLFTLVGCVLTAAILARQSAICIRAQLAVSPSLAATPALERAPETTSLSSTEAPRSCSHDSVRVESSACVRWQGAEEGALHTLARTPAGLGARAVVPDSSEPAAIEHCGVNARASSLAKGGALEELNGFIASSPTFHTATTASLTEPAISCWFWPTQKSPSRLHLTSK